MSKLQTLDRGIQALMIVARTPEGLTIAGLAEELGVDRAIAYRIVATLEAHHMLTRQGSRVMLGGGVLALERGFVPQLRHLARPVLDHLARQVGATAFVTLAQGAECTVIQVSEPDSGLLRVSYRVGSRHAIDQGAAGVAILSARPALVQDPAPVRQARAQGYALSEGVLQAGAIGVACPIPAGDRGGFEASIGVVALSGLDQPCAIAAVQAAAAQLQGLLST